MREVERNNVITIEPRRQPKWTKRRSDGKKTSNHYFNFCVLSQQQHTFIASKARAYSLYTTQQKFISILPRSHFVLPFRGKHPTPGSTDQFSWHIHREFSIAFCADGTFIWNGTEWHERRRGALYCIIFYTHFPSNIQSCVLYQIGREEKKAEGKWHILTWKAKNERRKYCGMVWRGKREERRENNSSNNIRKFILKAHSILFFFFLPFEVLLFFSSLRSKTSFSLPYETLGGG